MAEHRYDRLLEVIFAGVILVGLGWVAVNQYGMNGTLSSVKSDLTATSDRVNRMATAFPELAHHYAATAVRAPAKAVVVATKPRLKPSGDWVSNVHVFDLAGAKTISHEILIDATMHARPESTLAIIMTGSVYAAERSAPSLRELQNFAFELEKDTSRVPSYVVGGASYVLHNASPSQFLVTLEAIANVDSTERETRVLRRSVKNWQTVTGELRISAEAYSTTRAERDTIKPTPRRDTTPQQ